MKVNKWTLALAAVGLVSLPTLVQAEEKSSAVMTALSSTTISGYVDTSAQWDVGTGNAHPPGFIYNNGKQDGFNLDKVKLRIEKPLDETEWAAGYRVDLLFGPDANTFGSTSFPGGNTSDFAIQQAYVSLRAPVGNGLEFRVGAFDSIIGYESHDAVNNPNFTRSYGTTIEPHTHTGVLATYQPADWLGLAAGIANTVGPAINARANPPKSESYKTYMASVAVTVPEDCGFLKGSTFYGGFVNGFNASAGAPYAGVGADQTSWYLGSTLATPVAGLKLGLSFDERLVSDENAAGTSVSTHQDAAALYASYQATEKLSFHARGEYFWQSGSLASSGLPSKATALTGTVQYDLWKNVLSRLEIRWDHAANGVQSYGGDFNALGAPNAASKINSVMIAANIIYQF